MGEIGPGLLILVCAMPGDTDETSAKLAAKIGGGAIGGLEHALSLAGTLAARQGCRRCQGLGRRVGAHGAHFEWPIRFVLGNNTPCTGGRVRDDINRTFRPRVLSEENAFGSCRVRGDL